MCTCNVCVICVDLHVVFVHVMCACHMCRPTCCMCTCNVCVICVDLHVVCVHVMCACHMCRPTCCMYM